MNHDLTNGARDEKEQTMEIVQNQIQETDPAPPAKFPIITADQRMAEPRTIKGVLLGASGIGKTSQLWTLPAESTLFIDMEAGDLAVQDWTGDVLRPSTWPECRDIACFVGGPNMAYSPDMAYSQAHFDAVCQKYGDPQALAKYDTLFFDSITVASRLCFVWSQQQPDAFTAGGKPDNRGAYGLLGREMIRWLTQLQHTRGKNVWLVGILDEKTDDYQRRYFAPQIEGGKTALELPGIVDQVVTMAMVTADDGTHYRAFVCQTINPWAYPAKDRSGRLEVIEKPHLGELMEKIAGAVKPAPERLDFEAPAAPAPTPTTPMETEAEGASLS